MYEKMSKLQSLRYGAHCQREMFTKSAVTPAQRPPLFEGMSC